jgi:hypothetical protein
MALREAHSNPVGRIGPNRRPSAKEAFRKLSRIESVTSRLDEVRGGMIEKLTPATTSISSPPNACDALVSGDETDFVR